MDKSLDKNILICHRLIKIIDGKLLYY